MCEVVIIAPEGDEPEKPRICSGVPDSLQDFRSYTNFLIDFCSELSEFAAIVVYIPDRLYFNVE
jgi:hypothetical protein